MTLQPKNRKGDFKSKDTDREENQEKKD